MPVLDQGYVKLVKFFGEEHEIIEAARMSTGGEFNSWDTDTRLLSYLYNNQHLTPFEMVGMTVEVKAPIFVIREWMRHRVFSFNEASARYIPLPDEKYLPSVERVVQGIVDAGANKQAGSVTEDIPTEENIQQWLESLELSYNLVEQQYQTALNMGIPKELARICMPVGQYSTMRVHTNLRNWLGFLKLREAPNAQKEIQDYANAINKILIAQFPRTMALYNS